MFKVLVVDDERHIRNGIISVIDWELIGCRIVKDCANGVEAVDYLENNEVDIVISDIKMPGMNGIELAEYINLNKDKTKVILLTAYSDFTNAHLAIKHNVSEYVVKTDFIEELPRAIEKVKKLLIEEIRKESNIEALKSIVNENEENLRYKFLADLAKDIIHDAKEIEEKLVEYNLNNKSYYAIAYEFTSLTSFFYKDNEKEYKEIRGIQNFINMVFKDYEYENIIFKKNLGLIVLYYNDEFTRQNYIENLCKEVNNMVEQFTNYSIKFALSKKYVQINKLSEAYKEALEFLSKVYENKIYKGSKKASFAVKDINDIEYIKDIIISGDLEKIKKELSSIFDSFNKANLSLEQAKTKIIVQFSSYLSTFQNNNIANKDLKEQETIMYKKVNESKSMQTLFETSYFIVEYILDIVKNSESNKSLLVREANKYIRENYNNNINLNIIANHLHVNSSYLSRLYKKETGDTLIDALNRYRIEIAKKLLKRPSVKIFEVGSQVGIDDPAYFTHVFTKYCGCSPKEYKLKQ
ncbi:two-component system, response regulator YesN [Clostridium cavendishii DSM 21758]|uniref:Stage 0 sporulation protein A homolog n=1 Tax=Clostridium cavendishii DSM 21758 TaxID=1121302 RepID=A0A1M6GVI4_9CLOT|nr:response regulator [Clostridium cavendishii]SHJ13958.1 two-component system, response regulator YesN [Clostridium cavendishii DSM 21758]